LVLAILGEYPDPDAVKIVRSWTEAEHLAGDRGLAYYDEELPQIEKILGSATSVRHNRQPGEPSRSKP
jgi:hypothetical protein